MYVKQLIFLLIVELISIILYASVTQYTSGVTPNLLPSGLTNSIDFEDTYPVFQDVHVMIFIGFGFLMVFLRHHQLSSLTYNFLIAALSMQVSILFIGFWENVFHEDSEERFEHKIQLNLVSLISGDFAAGAVLISFGAVLGKLNSFQLCVMAVCETFFFAFNERLGVQRIKAVDVGGSMFIHAFGAFFGLGVSKIITKKEAFGNKNNQSNSNSNLIAMIGTLFLWMYWPSFNAALASGAPRHRAVMNTTFSIVASCIASFIFSPVLNNGKYEMEHILNATLAGGVIIGTNADLIDQPGYAFLIGFLGGTFSVIGFAKINSCFERRLKLHDTCGVNYLHGLPGVFAGYISIIFAATAGDQTDKIFGNELTTVFPAREYRSAGEQAGYQLLAVTVSVAIAIAGGLLTGLLLSCKCFKQPVEGDEMFVDEMYFGGEEVKKEVQEIEMKNVGGGHAQQHSRSHMIQQREQQNE